MIKNQQEMAAPCRQTVFVWKSIIIKGKVFLVVAGGVADFIKKVALALVELWMSVTHAGDVVGILLGAWLGNTSSE